MNAWRNLRDIILFLGGLAGLVNEALFQATSDTVLVLAFLAMMGVAPAAALIDALRQSK